VTDRQTVTVSIDIGELVDSLSWDVLRKVIDSDGAKGVGDGFGVITLRLNGHTSVVLHLHENRDGYVVVDLWNGHDKRHLATAEVELHGHVPPRMGAKAKKERRFGDEPLDKR
jgi:hypothetical protein